MTAALLSGAALMIESFMTLTAVDPGYDPDKPLPIAEGARRRRASFNSFEDALDNYVSKPPLSMLDDDCLRLYVGHGFRSAPEGVRIVCDPEHEARTLLHQEVRAE